MQFVNHLNQPVYYRFNPWIQGNIFAIWVYPLLCDSYYKISLAIRDRCDDFRTFQSVQKSFPTITQKYQLIKYQFIESFSVNLMIQGLLNIKICFMSTIKQIRVGAFLNAPYKIEFIATSQLNFTTKTRFYILYLNLNLNTIFTQLYVNM